MPMVLRNAPAAMLTRPTLDVAERQVLIRMDGADVGPRWWHHILMIHVDGARWITLDPQEDLSIDDLADETVVPLERATPFPAEGRPFFILEELTRERVQALRTRARSLAAIHGVPVAVPATPVSEGIWFFADPADDTFNHEIDTDIVGDPTRCIVRDAVALAQVDVNGTKKWTVAEHVRPDDRADWVEAKRTGAGRDCRLLPATKTGRLFREGARDLRRTKALPTTFRGPPAVDEVVQSIVASGVEPPAYHLQWVSGSGVNGKSAAAREHLLLLYALWLLVCVDGLDATNMATAEHLARRFLMIERATRRNPRSPDYEGLASYMEHMVEGGHGLPVAAFDRHVAELQRAEAQILKQSRLAREEQVADAKRKPDPKGKGRGKEKEEE